MVDLLAVESRLAPDAAFDEPTLNVRAFVCNDE
jgi:hypothetical protein